MGRTLHSILILLLLLPSFANTQSRYHFSTLGMGQGLSSNHAWSIRQDKYGFMWIGTVNGLNRYDGHNIRTYFNDPEDSFSIPGNAVFWIHKDSGGDMWFACGFNGVAKYNYTKDRFEKFLPYEQIKKRTGLPAPAWRIGEDQQKRIYFACGGACFRYTKSTGKIEDLTPLFKGKIEGYGVAMFIQQGNDLLWILTDNGLFLHNLRHNSIEQIPYDKERFGFGSAALIDATFINDEEMIITTPRSAFVLFNTHTRTFRPAPPFLDPAISKVPSTCGGVIKDSRGRVWTANSVYGLIEYLPDGKTISIKNEASYPYPYREQEGQGMHVYEDRNGNVWYGTSQRGVVWFQPGIDFITVYQRNYAQASSLPDDRVYSFRPASNGNMFVATGKSLTELQGGSFVNHPRQVAPSGNYPPAPVRHISSLHDTLVLATDLGLSFYHPKTNTFRRYVTKNEPYPEKHELFSNHVRLAHPMQPGVLLLVNANGEAARFHTQSGRCFFANYPDTADALYSFHGISSAAADSIRKKIWIEVADGQLHEYDPAARSSLRHHFTADTNTRVISSISIDIQGKLWLATNNGLVRYDPATKKGDPFTLPTTSQIVINVSCADGKTAWATTPTEVVRLDVATRQAVSFNLGTLMQNVVLQARSLFVDQQQNAWIGSNAGFCKIDGKSFRPQTGMLAPQLVDFRVFDEPKLFDRPYYELSGLELDYDENFFSFNFSSLDFNPGLGIRYAYKLQPFDQDWKTSDQNAASYTNVPPGSYKLILRTEYSLGKWRETALNVHIRAPYWQRWWFIGLLALGAALLFYFMYRLWRNRKIKQRTDEIIDYFANSMYGDNSASEICWDIARNCISQLKLEDCVVYLLDEKRDVLMQKAAYGPKNPKGHEIINPLEIKVGEGIVGAAASTGEPVLVKDTSADKRYIPDSKPGLSELAIPIIHEGKAIGVIDSEHSRRNFFTPAHVKVLSTIAAISANKIAESRAEAAATESAMQLLEIKKLLAETQLMALRAQMNPHFVFNCLNSIQECIVTQKYGEASLYLNKFSKLFRSVLNNSGRVMVTLAEEIEVLELYLTLEHMRFEKAFTYTIHTDEDLEVDEIMIPSMLLQPYVENALWHGLMHKPGDRRLQIAFNRQTSAVFECVIDDNGVGRKKSLEIKEQQQQGKRHVSRGMAISKDRIDLLRKQEQHATLEIIDKYNESGKASGTRVVIGLSSFMQ